VAAQGRLEGYRQALDEAGVVLDPTLVRNGHAEADGGYEEASALLELADPPTALFCGTDRMAMGAYDAIKQRGLRIKEDIAVIGFDNQELIADYVRPGLTTVALPFQEMGSQAVTLLSQAPRSPAQPDRPDQDPRGSRTVIDCPLIERASV
jgi:LacI family transcriptional regulator